MVIKNWLFKTYTNIISYVPPVILTQPLSATVAVNSNYTFYIKVKGSRPLSLQWYKDNTIINSLSSDTLLLSSIQISDSGYYYCRVGNMKYFYNSDIVELIVKTPPTITLQPSSYVVNEGEMVSIMTTVTGDGPISYKWYKNGVLTDATATNFYINNAGYYDNGSYFMVASNIVGSITSNTVNLSVIIPDVIIN